jgi:hypothetical protein
MHRRVEVELGRAASAVVVREPVVEEDSGPRRTRG